MRLFQLWLDINDGSEALLAMFRMMPSRRVWGWFNAVRSEAVVPDSRFRLSSLPDCFVDRYREEMFPRLDHIHLSQTETGIVIVVRTEPDF